MQLTAHVGLVGDSLTQPQFEVTSAEIAIVCRDSVDGSSRKQNIWTGSGI